MNQSICLSIFMMLFSVVSARPPPENCDSGSIQECLARFETVFTQCDNDDLRCQCTSIITSGANCYAACPQEAMSTFIKTYNDGRCATFDPYISRRDAEGQQFEANNQLSDSAANHAEEDRVYREWLGIASDNVKRSDTSKTASLWGNINQGDASKTVNASTTATKNHQAPTQTKQQLLAKEHNIESPEIMAITVTAKDPTTTISLSPQEYQSRLEKSRYKENLRSIRSERARLSSEAAARLAIPTEAPESRSTPRVSTLTPGQSSIVSLQEKAASKETKNKQMKSNGVSIRANFIVLMCPLLALL